MQEIRIKKVLMLLVLTFLCFSASKTLYAQTVNSIPTPETAAQSSDRERLVGALERAQTEVKASRNYVDGLVKQVKSKESIITAQEKRQTLSDEAIRLLKVEIGQLRAIIQKNEEGIAIQDAEIKFLKKELASTNEKLKRARKLNKILMLTAGAAITLILLR